MALTHSTMLALGTTRPNFQLPDVTSRTLISPNQFAACQGLLVMFICRHCPYVVHVQDALARLGKKYAENTLGIIAISSNDVDTYPDDHPDQLQAMVQELGFTFPYCYDQSQEVAKAFTAACTPDFFVFDHRQTLIYRGQLDDSRPGNGKPVTGKDLHRAIDAMLAGQQVNPDQRPSTGCNIKWKPGNIPSYVA